MKLNFLVEGFVSIWERGRKHLPRTIGFIEGVVVLAIALFFIWLLLLRFDYLLTHPYE
jgi:hypothetical protein